MTIQDVVNQYFFPPVRASYEQYQSGAVNLTYHLIVEEGDTRSEFILQRLRSIFDVSIMEDIKFITEYLAEKNIKTKRIIKTRRGALFVQDRDSWWRMFDYAPGRFFSAVASPNQAREAGGMAGALHSALVDCNYEFKFKLSHYHDTDFDIARLRYTLAKNRNTSRFAQLENLAESILISYQKLPKGFALPERIIHGDLKISNFIFDDEGAKVRAFVDVDTFMRSSIAVEMGDALRSWCMPGGEDAGQVIFDRDVYDAALAGYYSTAKFLTAEEKNSIPWGVKLMTLDLAARFATDALDENYFRLDSSKYASLFEQNKKRAENQLAFFKEFESLT